MSPRVAKFDWDKANLAHIARHSVTQSEVEEAFLDERSFLKRFDIRQAERRYTMLGMTADGRLLLVVYIIRLGAIRAVTAYTANRKDRETYAAARRKDGVRIA